MRNCPNLSHWTKTGKDGCKAALWYDDCFGHASGYLGSVGRRRGNFLGQIFLSFGSVLTPFAIHRLVLQWGSTSLLGLCLFDIALLSSASFVDLGIQEGVICVKHTLSDDPKRLSLLICPWHIEKRLNGTNKKIYSHFHIWRFDNLPLIFFGPRMLVLKINWHIFLEFNGKLLIKQGVKWNYCPTSSTFFAIVEGPNRKTDATFSNQF